MTGAPLRTRWLRAVRRMLAAAIALLVIVFPALEPAVIRLGRAASKRSRLLAGLYWVVQESMLARLRRGGERFRPVYVLGRRLQLDIADATGRLPYFYKTPYKAGVSDAIVTALRAGDVFVDVGANIGYFTVLAAQVVGSRGRVIAFEPHDTARDMLETMVQRNEASDRVDIVPCALADADGRAPLYVEEAASAHSTIEPALSPRRAAATLRRAALVPITTLDGWLAERPDLSGRVRCVKIGAEGAESRVLEGMAALLKTARLTIVCDTLAGGTADAILVRAGFQRRRIEPGASPRACFLYVRP